MELDPPAHRRLPSRGPPSGVCSGASSSSITRSSEAMPDWKTFIIDASCVSGIEKVREYWMKAWTSPTLMAPLATCRPPTTATITYCTLPEEHRGRLHEARHELGAEGGLEQLVVGLPEALLDLVLAPERLHDGVAGEGLLDLGVEGAGVAATGR